MSRKATSSPAQALLVSASLLLAGSLSVTAFYPAYGQGITTGTIVGSIVDSSGAAIANASVTATRPSTGVKLQTVTGGKGEFAFRNVPSGTYTISVESAGFGTQSKSIRVDAGQATNLEQVKMGVNSASSSVEVSSASTPLLQTTSAQVSTTFSSLQAEDLPLNGALDNIALLTPGVAIGHDDSFSNSNGNNLSINGNRSRSNNYEIDGQSNNDNSVGGPQIFFANQDAIQEIQVITSNFNAEYGRNTGGIVNYVTKSGTNRLHGSGYEFYNSSLLSSLTQAEIESPSTPTGPTLPHYVDNRYGGTLGGPVLRDKLWFFGGTNWEQTHQGFTPLTIANATPTQAGLAQLAAAFPNNPAVLAITTRGPLAVLPQVRQIGAATPQQITGPNGRTVPVEFARISTSIAPLNTDQEDLGRLDWQPKSSDHFYLRYIYQDTLATGVQQGNGYFYSVPNTTHSIGGDWSHTFSPSWVNQVHYGFQQSKLFFQGGLQPDCASTSLAACTSSFAISGSAGFGYANNLPQGRTVKVTEVQDNANFTHGKHSISFGGDFTYQNSPNTFLPNFNGSYSFSNFSNFVQQTGNLTLGNGNAVIPFTEPDFGLYVQDNWKLLSSLTLNLGFRYEFFTQAVNLLNRETVARENGPNGFWDPTLPLAARTYPFTQSNYKNLEPRFGFAFNPTSFPKLVVRGAYGIQYDPAFYNIFLNSATAAPVINLGTFACGGNCIPGGGAVFGSDTRATNLPRIPTGAGINPNTRNLTNNPSTFVNPRVQNFSLGFQYQIQGAVLGVTYVGNHVSRQFQSVDANPFLQPVAAAFPNFLSPSSLCQNPNSIGFGRLSCDNANVRTRNNNAFSNYNSLQVQLQTRNYHGVTVNASYTYSRVIDNVDEIFGAGSPAGTTSSPAFAQNPLQTDGPERGVANFSYPNLGAVGLTYELPFSKSQGGLRGRLLGGYEFSAAYAYNNGESYSPQQFYSATTFNFNNATPNVALNTSSYCDIPFNASFVGADTCRPIISNPRAPVTSVGIYVVDPTRSVSTGGTGFYNYQAVDANTGRLNTPIAQNQAHWLYNNRAYANLVGNPFPGSPRNIIRGQSFNNLDASFIKNTAIREGISLKLYLNAFNALNRPFYGTPDTSIEDSTFGTTVNSSGSTNGVPAARYVQLGAKVVF